MSRKRRADPEASYRQYDVSRKHREPLVGFIIGSLELSAAMRN